MTNRLKGIFGTSPRRAASLLVAAFLASTAAGAAADCRLREFASVPISFDESGRILLNVKVDGAPTQMLLDTGSGISLFDRGFVERSGLSLLDAQSYGYGFTGKSIDFATQVGKLSLGRAVSEGQTFAVGTVERDGAATPPAGIFGDDYLANFDVEIDPVAGRAKLFTPDHCRGEVVYWAKEYFKLPATLTEQRQLQVEIQINGTPLRAVIDTGLAETTMRQAASRARFGITLASAGGDAHGTLVGVEGTKLETVEHRFDSLTFGGITVRNAPVMIADIDVGRNGERVGQNIEGIVPPQSLAQRPFLVASLNSFNQHIATHVTGDPGQPDVLIGMALLRRLHLFLDYHEPAVYYTLAEERAAD